MFLHLWRFFSDPGLCCTILKLHKAVRGFLTQLICKHLPTVWCREKIQITAREHLSAEKLSFGLGIAALAALDPVDDTDESQEWGNYLRKRHHSFFGKWNPSVISPSAQVINLGGCLIVIWLRNQMQFSTGHITNENWWFYNVKNKSSNLKTFLLLDLEN